MYSSHDHDKENGGSGTYGDGKGCDGQGFMSYGNNLPNKWSHCSNSNFKDWFTKTGIYADESHPGFECLKPSASIGKIV